MGKRWKGRGRWLVGEGRVVEGEVVGEGRGDGDEVVGEDNDVIVTCINVITGYIYYHGEELQRWG